ncbi:MAG: hypothetical protein ABSH19_01675 [Opitutales bacterium]|jgi:hypothetical protein
MQPVSSPQEVAELEIALERARRVPAFRALLLLCWGLIMAKCLLVQWAILTYHERINGVIMVWVPSVSVCAGITLYYAYRVFRELPTMPLSGRIVSATWVGCGTAFLVLIVAVVVFGEFSGYLLPALAAVLLGVGYYIHSATGYRVLFRAAAVGWWFAALWLFGHPDIDSLAWMSLFLVLFEVLPATWLYFAARRAAKLTAPKPA